MQGPAVCGDGILVSESQRSLISTKLFHPSGWVGFVIALLVPGEGYAQGT